MLQTEFPLRLPRAADSRSGWRTLPVGNFMHEAIYDINRLRIGPNGVDDFLWPVARSEIIAVRDAFLAKAHPYLRHEGQMDRQALLVGVLAGAFLG